MTINDYVSPYESISEVQEKWKLVPAFLETRGLVKQHLGLARKPRFLFFTLDMVPNHKKSVDIV